jgi:hypothetical protein
VKSIPAILLSAILLAPACAQEPQPAPPPPVKPNIPGEPVLAIPGQRQAPPPPPELAPAIPDAGADAEPVRKHDR